MHVVPKKGGMTIVKNESNELIPTKTVTRWRVCIDYKKLNDATRKDHFPLPFINQMVKNFQDIHITIFLMGIRDTIKSQLHQLIKRKLLLHVLMALLLLEECLLVFVMHLLLFRGV